jgi:hypothetical protein
VIEFFVHPQRVANPREAAALVGHLGVHRVRLTQHRTRSWVLKDPASIQRVFELVEPTASGTMIEFEGITREATLPALEQLVTGDAQFVSIAGNGVWFRGWPRRNEAFVDELAIDRSQAFERFRPACTLTWINGSVSEPGADVVACLPRLVGELDQPEVELDLDLSLAAALALVLEFPDAEIEWTGGVVLRFPAGEILTYQLNPAADHEAAWRERIATALAAIR